MRGSRPRARAAAHGLKTVAFPAISCGAYGYPLAEAVAIAVRECAAYLGREAAIEKITFACFNDAILQAYEAELARL